MLYTCWNLDCCKFFTATWQFVVDRFFCIHHCFLDADCHPYLYVPISPRLLSFISKDSFPTVAIGEIECEAIISTKARKEITKYIFIEKRVFSSAGYSCSSKFSHGVVIVPLLWTFQCVVGLINFFKLGFVASPIWMVLLGQILERLCDFCTR